MVWVRAEAFLIFHRSMNQVRQKIRATNNCWEQFQNEETLAVYQILVTVINHLGHL